MLSSARSRNGEGIRHITASNTMSEANGLDNRKTPIRHFCLYFPFSFFILYMKSIVIMCNYCPFRNLYACFIIFNPRAIIIHPHGDFFVCPAGGLSAPGFHPHEFIIA